MKVSSSGTTLPSRLLRSIIDHLSYQIANSGYGEMLNAGIVVTGGGSQLKDLSQLFTLHTGYDVRIGQPNINTVANTDNEMNSPMHATGIGLMLLGFEDMIKREEDEEKAKAKVVEEPAPEEHLEPTLDELTPKTVKPMKTKSIKESSFIRKIKQNIGDLFSDDDISFDQKS